MQGLGNELRRLGYNTSRIMREAHKSNVRDQRAQQGPRVDPENVPLIAFLANQHRLGHMSLQDCLSVLERAGI